MLIKELLQYKEIDNGTSESALKAISRHLWYLCEELVPLSLFDDELDVDEKERLLLALNATTSQVRIEIYNLYNTIKNNLYCFFY